MRVNIYQVDAFTRIPFGGNPAGVVPDASGLTEEDMQKMAREMNCSETAFVFPCEDGKADFKVRFFTPSAEVDLCGHATIATFYTLAKEGMISLNAKETILYQDTKAGVLPVTLLADDNNEIDTVIMGQALPKIVGESSDRAKIAQLLGLEERDLELNGLPLQIVSTGLPVMMVPVKDLATLKKAKPDFPALAAYSREKGFISIHAFTFETENEKAAVHTRDFAPSVDIDEEAATGTANGALGAYLVINKALPLGQEKVTIAVEQGYVMNRPSEIIVEITHRDGDVKEVKVGGSARIVLSGVMEW